MTDFYTWQATGRAFSPADAEAMFGWDGPDDVKRVFVYRGPCFVDILEDDTPVFAVVAQTSHQDAEEAAFRWWDSTKREEAL